MMSKERRRRTLRGVGTVPRDERDGPVDGSSPRNLRILEAVFHEAAMIASEDTSPASPEELEDELAIATLVARLLEPR